MSTNRDWGMPDYQSFMQDLEDPSVAVDFLLMLAEIGWRIKELDLLQPVGESQDLEFANDQCVEIAKKYFTEYYLKEYPLRGYKH